MWNWTEENKAHGIHTALERGLLAAGAGCLLCAYALAGVSSAAGHCEVGGS